METNNTNIENRNSSSQPPISIDFEEDSDFTFKPLTKGLGFHNKKDKIHEVKQHRPINRSNSRLNNSIYMPEVKENTISKPVAYSQFNDSSEELEASLDPSVFNQTNLDSKDSDISEKVGSESISLTVDLKQASFLKRFSSWVLDLIFVFLVTAAVFFVFYLVSGFSLNQLQRIMTLNDLLIYSAVFAFIFYTIYFSLFDLTQTIGKKVCNISVKTTDNEAPQLRHTFTRTLITLIGMIVVFPNVFDFQGKLSDTVIIED